MLLKFTIFCIAVVSSAVGSGYGPTTCSTCQVADCGLLPSDRLYTCPNGNILDSCGCVTSCQCAGCPTFDLNLSCPFGKKTDQNDCPLSQCNPPPCEFANDCLTVKCGHGITVDENNCPLRDCPCKGSRQCPVVTGCNIDCSQRGGYKKDQNNCVTCDCVRPLCEFAFDCAAVTCFADFGNAVDENGCALRGCPCQGAANCPAVIGCDLDCSNRGGYATDSNKCVRCQCVSTQASCPRFGVWGPTDCNNDNDCLGAQKCCPVSKYSTRKICYASRYK